MKYKTRQRIKLNYRQLLENKNKKTRKQRGGSIVELATYVAVITVILVLAYIIDKIFALAESIGKVIELYTDHIRRQNLLKEGYTFDNFNRPIPPAYPTPEQLKLTAKREKREKYAKDMEARAIERDEKKAAAKKKKKGSAAEKVYDFMSEEEYEALNREKRAKIMGYESFNEMKNIIYKNFTKSSIEREVQDADESLSLLEAKFDEAVRALAAASAALAAATAAERAEEAAERAEEAADERVESRNLAENIILLKAKATTAKAEKEKAAEVLYVAKEAWMGAKLKETAWNAADAEANAEVPPLEPQVVRPANNAEKLMYVLQEKHDDDHVKDKITNHNTTKEHPGRDFTNKNLIIKVRGETEIAANNAAEKITSTLADAVLQSNADATVKNLASEVLSDDDDDDTDDEGKLREICKKIKKVCFILNFIPSPICSIILRIIIPIIFKNCSDAKAFSVELCIFFKNYDRTTDIYTQILQLPPLVKIMKEFRYVSNPVVTQDLNNMISDINTKSPAETLNELKRANKDNKLDGSRNTKYKLTFKLPKMSKFFQKFRLYRPAPLTVQMASDMLNDQAKTTTVLQDIAREVESNQQVDTTGPSGGGQKHSKKNKTSKKIRRMQKKSKYNIL